MRIELRPALLALSLLLPCPVPAQEGGRGVRRAVPEESEEVQAFEESHALLIGVRQYKNGWSRLPGVQRDIERVQEVLRQHGFDSEVLMDPTRAELDEGVRRFIGQWGQIPGNRLLVYFAGHGHTLKTIDGRDVGYLVPADAPLPRREIGAFREQAVGLSKREVLTLHQEVGSFKAKAISMSQIEGYALEIEARQVLFIFDSCFSGSLFDTLRGRPESMRAKVGLPVRQFITAGKADQQVPDESIFSAELVEGLRGEADLIPNGVVTGTELGMFLEEEVTKYSRGTQTPMYGKIRHPKLDKGEFTFILPEELRNRPARSWVRSPARSVHARFEEVRVPAHGPEGAALRPGAPLERELAPQEAHVYELSLGVGQYADVTVEQQGVDVVVVVTDPRGAKIIEVDGPAGDRGTEEVQWIASLAGLYQLEVRSVGKGSAPGRYRISAQDPRAATEQDRVLEQASRLANEATVLFAQGRYSAALESAQKARTLLESALGGDHLRMAEILGLLSAIYLESGEYDQAELHLTRALAIRDKAADMGPPLAITTLLDRLASAQEAKGRYAEAEQSYRRALAIRESLLGGDHPEVATTLSKLGRILAWTGRYLEAEALDRRALAIQEQSLGADSPEVAASLNNLASVRNALGDYAGAEALYRRALATHEKALGPDHPYVAKSLHNLAALYNETHRYAEALPLLQRALAINEKAFGSDHLTVAQSWDNLGALHLARGDLVAAEVFLRRALAIREKIAPEDPDLAITLGNLGALHHRKQELARAREAYRRALAIYEKNFGPRHLYIADTLLKLGVIAAEGGNVSMIPHDLVLAQTMFKELDDPQREAQAWRAIGRALASHRGATEVADYLRKALALYRKVRDRQGEVEVLGELGSLYTKTKDLQGQREAIVYFLQALQLARELDDRQLQTDFLDELGRIHEALGDEAMARQYRTQAGTVWQDEWLARLNRERERAGAPPLRLTPVLAQVAQQQADEMARGGRRRRFPSAEAISERLRQVGYSAHDWRERLVLADTAPETALASMPEAVDRRFRDLGVGTAVAEGVTFHVLLFGWHRGDYLAGATAWLADRERIATEMLSRVNDVRRRAGLAPLAPSPLLDRVSQEHAEDMLARSYSGHRSPEGVGPSERAWAHGYRASIGENIVEQRYSVEEALEAWLASPGQRRNILDPGSRELGLGLAVGAGYDAAPGGYRVIWVQSVGRGE